MAKNHRESEIIVIIFSFFSLELCKDKKLIVDQIEKKMQLPKNNICERLNNYFAWNREWFLCVCYSANDAFRNWNTTFEPNKICAIVYWKYCANHSKNCARPNIDKLRRKKKKLWNKWQITKELFKWQIRKRSSKERVQANASEKNETVVLVLTIFFLSKWNLSEIHFFREQKKENFKFAAAGTGTRTTQIQLLSLN